MAPISGFYSCIVFFTTLASIPISSLSFESVTRYQVPNFGPEISLFGDAHIVAGESAIKLTRRSASSYGLLLHPKPFKFLRPELGKTTSFSTEFSFAISSGDGIALLFVPVGFEDRFGSGQYGLSRENKFLGIEFDTSMDGNHVGVDVGSLVSSTVGNVSSLDLVLKSGEKLKSWVDYDSNSNKLEIRLTKLGKTRPHAPILTHPIDLSKMWSDEDVFVGLSSSNGGSSQTSSVYSWKFTPADCSGEHGGSGRKVCPLTVLAGMIFGTACGALFAFVVLFVWAILGQKRNLFPVENQFLPVNLRYEKVDIVVEKRVEN